MKLKMKYLIFLFVLIFPIYCHAEVTETTCFNDGLNALMETANAYYSQGKQLQYDSFKKILSATPEDATSKNYIYTVCSGFTYQTYNQTLGIKLPDTTKGLINYAIERRKAGDKTNNIVFWASKADGDPTSDSREKIYSKVKKGDIVVYQSSKGNGHALLIEKVDTNEKIISILEGGGRTVKDEKEDYDPKGAISSKDFTYTQFQENYESKYKLAIIRIINKDYIKVDDGVCKFTYTNKNGDKKAVELTSSAQARLKLPKIYIAKIIKKEENQNYAKIGEKLNYQLVIRNKNTSKDYTNLKVLEKITILNSDGTVYKKEENVITKDNISIPKKTSTTTSEEIITFTYTIPNNPEYIGKIVLSEGKVSIGDYSIATSKIVTKIGNPIKTENITDLVDGVIGYNSISSNRRKFIYDLYNKTLGLNLSFITKKNVELLKNNVPINASLNHLYGKYYGLRINHNINTNSNSSSEEKTEANNLINEGLSIYDFDAWDIYASNTILDRARTLNVSMLRPGDIILANICSARDTDGSGNTNGNCLSNENVDKEYIYLENVTIEGEEYSKALFRKNDKNKLEIISYDDKYYSSIGFDTDTLNAFLRDLIGENYVILRPHLPSLTIKSMPKKTYIQNYEDFDISGGKLSAIYNDSSNKEEIDFSKATITGFNNSKVTEEQEITVKYDGSYVTYNVSIVSKQVTSIEIHTLPIKNDYIQNYENLDLYGGYITVKYNDKSIDKVSLTNDKVKVTGFDNSKVGTNELTVSYSGHSTKFNVDIVSKQVTGIEVNSLPTKIDYIQNYEDLDLSGGSVKILYDDNTTSTMSMKNTNIKVTGFDNSKVGSNSLTVTYLTNAITFNVNIISKQIIDMSVSTLPTKKVYIQNYDKLDLSGGFIKVTYDDNTENLISLSNSKVNVTGFDNTKIGNNTLTVSYFGHTTTYEVIIVSKELTSISIDTMPNKKEYIQNYEDLDLTGGFIKVNYNDNTSDIISMDNSNVIVNGFSNKKLGSNKVQVNYLSKTTSFTVNIISKKIKNVELDTTPTKKDYIQNYEDLDLTGGFIKVTYDDNSISRISMLNENISFEGFSNSSIGTSKVYVYYMSYQVDFSVNIISKQVVGMNIKKKPTKTTYIQNYEDLDLTGGIITVKYTNNSTSEISLSNENIKISGFNNSNIGTNKITIEYLGFKDEFNIDIISRQAVSILISKMPNKIKYSLNSKQIDLTGGEITITYNDNTTSTTSLTDNNVKVKGFDTSKIGTKKIVIDYFGNLTSFEIEVESDNVTNPKTVDLNIITIILTLIGTLIVFIVGLKKLKKYKDLLKND